MNTDIIFFPRIQQFLESLSLDLNRISSERRERLEQIADYIQKQISNGKSAELIFICTHNSRRSHFGQVWAKVLADYYGIGPVYTYSGGTEATAFNPNAIEALRSVGLQVSVKTPGENPHYEVQYGASIAPLEAWSKVYDDSANPNQNFCAVMTCSEADEACPIVFGAEERVPLPFEDPKKSDGTPQQVETYLKRSYQIASELAFVFQKIKAEL